MSTLVLAASLAASAQMIASQIFLISVPRRRAAACDGTSNALAITASARIAERQIELSAGAHVDELDRAQEAGILRLAMCGGGRLAC